MAAMVNMNSLINGKDSRWLQLEVCREFQRNKCSRPDTECKFAHPPANVEVQNGRVTACYDSIKVSPIIIPRWIYILASGEIFSFSVVACQIPISRSKRRRRRFLFNSRVPEIANKFCRLFMTACASLYIIFSPSFEYLMVKFLAPIFFLSSSLNIEFHSTRRHKKN